MSGFKERLEAMDDPDDRRKYVDSLVDKLSNSEEGEWLAYELSRLYTLYLRELGEGREEDIKNTRGKLEMLRDLFTRLRMASYLAENRHAERIDRGSRRWTPRVTEDPGLL